MARWFRDRSARQGIPLVSLRRLFPEARFEGCRDLEVSGCSNDGRRIEPGELFIATRPASDPARLDDLRIALDRGAAGVLSEHAGEAAGPVQVIVPDAKLAHARICRGLAGEPGRQLDLIAIAGTEGRSATALFLRSIFESVGRGYGYVGRLGWSDGAQAFPPAAGPGPFALATMLGRTLEHRCEGAIIELSPGLLEHRPDETCEQFGAVILGRLDDLEETPRRNDYKRIVRRVIDNGQVIASGDSREAGLLSAACLAVPPTSYRLDAPAEISARTDRMDAEGTVLSLRGPGMRQSVPVRLRPIGRAHARSALAAAALAITRRVPIEAVVAGLEAVERIPGRIEAVREGQPFTVWLDERRSTAGLTDALKSLRAISHGPLACVLDLHGVDAIGDDLLRVALELSDTLTITGAPASPTGPLFCRQAPDWPSAIASGLRSARPGSALLIVGAGRRRIVQEAGRAIARDDASHVRAELRQMTWVQRRSA